MSDLNQNNNNTDNKKFKYLSFEDREYIQKMKGFNFTNGVYTKNNLKILSNRKIGRVLNKSHTTIGDELKRYFHAYSHEKIYKASKAHKLFLINQKSKGNTFKLIDYKDEGDNFRNKKLKDFVLSNLKEGLSPEQISGRIRELKLGSELGGTISYETIYNFIYNSPEGKKDKLYKYLRRHRKKPIKYGSRRGRSKGGSIKNLVKISERNKDLKIKHREEIGHWETDSMIFSNQKYILSVQVERKSRLVHITKLENKTAEKTLLALKDLYKYANDDISRNGLNIVKTMTFDRGLEGAYHYELTDQYGIKTYFCNPYSSRQKGGVENMNMFIREYFPRSTDMKNITDDYIKEVQDKLNNRPRKCLNYLTPKEFMEIEINKEIKKNG